MWVVLTEPEKRNGRWDADEFFETGRDLVAGVLKEIEEMDVSLRRGRALDFGCGVGRLTQALSQHFESVVGVDISSSMIREAERHNSFPDRCRYVLNTSDNLRIFGDAEFDFVFSTIVLQHIHPRYATRYIAEFLRILRPGGMAVFQIPEKPAGTLVGTALRFLPNWLVRPVRQMDMYAVGGSRIRDIVESGDSRLVAAQLNQEAGPHWIAHRYFVQKNAR